jgi:hypothetical protein
MVLGEGLRSEAMLIAAGFALAAGCTLLAVFAVSRSLALAAALTAASVLIYPVSYGYPKLLVYAVALVVAAAYSAAPRPSGAAWLGAVAGIGFLFRHDHGVLVLAALFILMVARHGLALTVVRRFGVALVVALLVVSPYLAWVQAYEGIGTYFSEGVRFSAREAERSAWTEVPTLALDRSKPLLRRLARGPVIHVRWQPGLAEDQIRRGERRHDLRRLDPMGPLSWQYEIHGWSRGTLEALVRDPEVADTDGIDRSAFRLKVENPPRWFDSVLVRIYAPDEGLRLRSNGVVILFYLSWLLPVVSLVALVLRWRTLPDTVRAPVAMTIALHLAMNLTMLRDPFDLRVRDLIVPVCVLGGFLLGLAWHARAHVAVRVLGRAAALVVVGAFAVMCGAIGDASGRTDVIDEDHTWDGLERRAAELDLHYAPPYERTGKDIESSHYAPLVRYVTRCTPPEARIFSLTFAPEVFFYTRRGFAGGQVAITPGYYTSERDASLMLERVGREDVPLVLLDSETEHEIEIEYPRAIMDAVRSRYHEVLRTKVGPQKDFVLLAQNDRKVLGRDGGRPCFTPASR